MIPDPSAKLTPAALELAPEVKKEKVEIDAAGASASASASTDEGSSTPSAPSSPSAVVAEKSTFTASSKKSHSRLSLGNQVRNSLKV